MISADLQLDVLADRNIFLEREGGNMFEWKDIALTNLPFMQEMHDNGKIPIRQTLLHPHQSIAQDPGIWPPKLLAIPKFTMSQMMSLYISKRQFCPVGWEWMSTQHHRWDQCSCLGYRTEVTTLRFEGVSATPRHPCLLRSCISFILKVKSVGKWARSKFSYNLTLNLPCFSKF